MHASPVLRPIALALLVLTTAGLHAAPSAARITVQAGPHHRQQTVVRFPAPEGFEQAAVLRRDGREYPVQIDARKEAVFVLDQLASGKTAEFELSQGRASGRDAGRPGIQVQRMNSAVQVSLVNGNQGSATRPLFAYQAEPGEFPRADIKEAFRRGGYIHPLFAPNGRLVTDDFPPNHIHHHGIWSAWTSTEFQGRKPDFWNMGDNKGRVEFERVEATWNGVVHGGFRARHRFVDLLAAVPTVALHESWTVTAYSAPADARGTYIFDLESEQECATPDVLKLPEYRYGGLGLRGNWAWNGKTNTWFLTSEGETDRDKGNATRGRWCDMSGNVEGERVGLAMLGHPANFRAPQPMRLHPTEPFFNFAPQQAGDMAIEPGRKYVTRYRFVVHNGPPDAAELNRLWNDFAEPPVVTINAATTKPWSEP